MTVSASDATAMRRVALNSVVGSAWTLVSRVSGLFRVAAVAAVLGPTQFANLYQATNLIPNLTFELLTGALFASLVVPALVRHLDRDEVGAAARLASGFLTLAVLAATGLVIVSLVAGPLVLGLVTAGAPETLARTGMGAAWLLLGLLLLQVPMYLIVGMAAAVQNARGRFALAAAAPSVENLGIIVVMVAYGFLFGLGASPRGGLAEVAVLGGGTTGAVALHALVQWWGARRCGVTLRPHVEPRDPEVRAVARLAVPSLGYSGLSVARYFCILVAAGAVPGGVVAFTLALAFYNLPVALGAKPVAQAALPALSRSHQAGDDAEYTETFNRSFGLFLFVVVPAAVGYVLLAEPLATAVSFGAMATPEGRELVQGCLLGVSLGLVGEAMVVFGTQAAYARRDGRRPLVAVALRTVLGIAGMVWSVVALDGLPLLVAIGVSVAVSDLAAGFFLTWVIRRRLPRAATSLPRMGGRTALASLAMVPPVLLVSTLLGPGPGAGQGSGILVVALAGAVGALAYGFVQWLLGSPELAGLLSVLRRRREHGPEEAGRAVTHALIQGDEVAAAHAVRPRLSVGSAEVPVGTPLRMPPDVLGPGPLASERPTAELPLPSSGERRLVLAFLVVALLAAPVLAVQPALGLLGSGAALLVLGAALRPALAVTAYVAATPLLVGLGRGALVPGLRLNEAVLFPVLLGVGFHLLRRWTRGERLLPGGVHRLDLAVLAVAVTSSVTTLLWMYARSRPIAVDDLLYALALWKLAALYAAVRLVLRRPDTIQRTLLAVVVSSCLVGGVGVLQALGVGPVISVIATWLPPEEGGYELSINRATATLGNPIAYGDLLIYASVVAAALAYRQAGRRRGLWVVAGSLALAALASGQISVLLGLLTAGVAFAVVTRTAARAALAGSALLAVALVALQPVITARARALDPATGLPVSWTGRYGRIDNLRRYFWPEIGADWNWVFGVQTSSRAPGAESWRDWVYIESGYTWALWNGGLPLLVAVLALVVLVVRTGHRLARRTEPLAGAVGVILATVGVVLGVLLFLDPHLTLRGAADVLFVLFGLGATTAGRESAAEPGVGERPRVPVPAPPDWYHSVASVEPEPALAGPGGMAGARARGPSVRGEPEVQYEAAGEPGARTRRGEGEPW